MGTELMEMPAQAQAVPVTKVSEPLHRYLRVPMGTQVGVEQVQLEHTLADYLRGGYLKRSRSFKKSTGRSFPFPFDRVLYLEHVQVEGESRDPHTMVMVSGLEQRGVGVRGGLRQAELRYAPPGARDGARHGSRRR